MAIYYQPPQPFLGSRQPLEGRKLTPDSTDNPPFGGRRLLWTVLAAWQLVAPPLQLRPGIVPEAAAVEAPVLSSRPWFPAVIASWQAEVPASTQRRILPPESAPDDPPFGSRPWLGSVLSSWQFDLKPEAAPRRVVPEEAGPPADDLPFGLRPWLSAVSDYWNQPGPLPARPRLTPILCGGIRSASGTITYQNNEHGDTTSDGIPGSYSFIDISKKMPLELVELGALGSQKLFDAVSNINNGGTCPEPTSFIAEDSTVVFRSTKTFQVSATGAIGRSTRLGRKEGTGLKAGGSHGIKMYASPNSFVFRGLTEIYDSHIINVSSGFGSISFFPAVDDTGELIGSIFENPVGLIGSLGTATFRLSNIFDCTFVHKPSIANAMSINVNHMEQVTFVCVAGGTVCLPFTGTLQARDIFFAGSPSSWDLRPQNAAAGGTIRNPTWSRVVPQIGPSVTTSTYETWDYGVLIEDKTTAAPLAGLAVELLDKDDVTVVDTTTDATGQIDFDALGAIEFGTELYKNCVVVVQHAAGVPETPSYRGPWTLKVNHKGTINPAYETYERKIDWPYEDYAYGRQYKKVNMVVSLGPPPGPVPEPPVGWIEKVGS